MRLSRTLKSSTQSLPSPDGLHIATILSSKLLIRLTRSLETTRVLSLPSELLASISWFIWSPSSDRVLVGSNDYIRVYSIANSTFSATITHPVSVTKATFIAFGATDDEICVFSDFGLKFSIFNLKTSKSVDINSPKFYHPGVASRGCSYRPRTGHLALLTREGGKDIVSIHLRESLKVVRSWCPDTVDAQGLEWSADGCWLMIWESASQGHRILMYTADGHPFKTWNGPLPISEEDTDPSLGAGVKLLEWSKDIKFLAVGDFSRRVTVLTAPDLTEYMSLLHPTAIKPTNLLQIWQEQFSRSQISNLKRDFVQATQTICPPKATTNPTNASEAKTGTNILTFDNSNTLLATRTEDMPTTLWIWDIKTRTLRSVLILHAPIARATWHPSINELLLIRCEGDDNRGLAHVWHPSWDTPKILDFNAQIPGGKVLGKTLVRWLNIESSYPVMFFSDSQDCMLVSLSGPEDGDLPWTTTTESPEFGEQSNLSFGPSGGINGLQSYRRSSIDDLLDNSFTSVSGGSEPVDDTFHFRKHGDSKDGSASWT